MYRINVLEQTTGESNEEFAIRLNDEFETIHQSGFDVHIYNWSQVDNKQVVYFNIRTVEEQARSNMNREARAQKIIQKNQPKISKPTPNMKIN